jgi:hypothetical protein
MYGLIFFLVLNATFSNISLLGQAKQCGGVKRHMIYEPSSPDNSKPGCSMS